MKIEVTQEHIKKGLACSSCNCPLALALRAHFPAATVALTTWTKDNHSDYFILPDEAADFRRNFDDGYPVQPFTFEV